MLPIIILAAVVVPLLVFAFIATRRSRAGSEHLPPEAAGAQLRTEEYEDEFEKAEDYQAKWREEQRGHERDDSLY